MLPPIWGTKTVALFDLWSLEHLLSGISIGYIVKKRTDARFNKIMGYEWHDFSLFHFDLTGVLFLAYLWETFEHYLEVGLLGPGVEHWMYGVEFWANRFITDPLLLVIGYLIAKRYPGLVNWARLASIIFLVINFMLPTSMSLQQMIFGS